MPVATGYELVEHVFNRETASRPGGCSVSIRLAGDTVVDLWRGESSPGVPWSKETPAVLMSATKALATLCLQILVDQGAIEVNAPVTKYWPEYGRNGKQDTLVEHILLHTAGMIGWQGAGNELLHDGTGWTDLDLIVDRIAQAPPSWKPGTKHGYHALTYGWLIGEIVRRVTGQTLGTFFRDEIAAPLGISTTIGTPEARFRTVAKLDSTYLYAMPFPISAFLKRAKVRMRTPGNLMSLAFCGNGSTSAMDSINTLLDTPTFISAEIPSSNGTSSSDDLSKVFAMLANGGELQGTRILSERIVAQWALPLQRATDEVLADVGAPFARPARRRIVVVRSLGYVSNVTKGIGLPIDFGPVPGAYGMEGAGGQIGFADPKNNVSFALVRSDLSADTRLNRLLIEAFYTCLQVRSQIS